MLARVPTTLIRCHGLGIVTKHDDVATSKTGNAFEEHVKRVGMWAPGDPIEPGEGGLRRVILGG